MAVPQTRMTRTNEVIFREGEPGECAYLIEQGRVLIFVEKDGVEIPLRILGEGEVVGEMALIDNDPRSASCRAFEDTRLIVVTKEQLLGRIQSADPVVRLLMRVLLQRLRSQNDSVRGKNDIPSGNDTLAADKKAALDLIGLENRLATAVDNDEFAPFYQPIVDLTDSRMIGCEALLRWFPKSGETISPSVFMDVIEESSLILKVGRVVIEKSLADVPRMKARFGDDQFFISINVSGRQFADPLFIEHLEETRARHGVSASQIKLELTERILMEGPQVLFTLQTCRNMGYRLAIDDFGTGFSSLQYLAQMPLSDLKIDRTFVMSMLNDRKSESIVRSLIHLSNLLGLNIIAEGIELKEQADLLRELKVPMGQGFLFSRPLSLADLLKFEPAVPIPTLKVA